MGQDQINRIHNKESLLNTYQQKVRKSTITRRYWFSLLNRFYTTYFHQSESTVNLAGFAVVFDKNEAYLSVLEAVLKLSDSIIEGLACLRS